MISPLSEFGAPCLPSAIHFETGTRREWAQTAAQNTRSLDQQRPCPDWTTTAVHHLLLSQTCALTQEELRSHPALPPSRASLRALPHFGFCLAAALGKCCTRLLGKPEIRGQPGSQLSGDALQSCRPGRVVRLRNMAAARLQRVKKAQEPHIILK